MVSIILPIYNAEQFLHRCIDSILAQSYTDFELLLIDDGSTDGSGTICDEFAKRDSRIRVFHKVNGGVSSARNMGLDNARGEYLTFCDADDYVGEDWLAAYSEIIENKVDLAIQGYYAIDGDNTVEKKMSPSQGNAIEDKRQLITLLMCEEMYGYLWVKLFRRQLIENHSIRFDERSAFREDEQFFSKYLEYVISFVCIDRLGYYYVEPPIGKPYDKDVYYSLFPIFQSLDVIFDGEIPSEICRRHYVNVKDSAVKYLSEGKRLTDYHIDLYYRIVHAIGYITGIKHRVLNYIILKSPQWDSAATLTVRMMRKILS